MAQLQKITPCLWFDSQAADAAMFYTSIFKHSRIVRTTHYTEAGRETHKKQPGSVLTVEFEIEGEHFTALNGGPEFKFTEAVSFMINCKTQEEIDYYWGKLTPGGDPKAQICGWLKDKFGLSWQVAWEGMPDLLNDPDRAAAGRAMEALMKMKKLDIATIKQAHAGESVRA